MSRQRYLTLWVDLLAMSWRLVPGRVSLMFGGSAAAITAAAVAALEMRDTVDASLRGDAHGAVFAACTAALAGTLSVVLQGILGGSTVLVVEKVAMTELYRRTHLEIAALEGIEHLENPEFLDRMEIVRGSGWGLVQSLWTAVRVAFAVVQLVVMMTLLGSVSPWLLSLVAFAAVPPWFEQRGKQAVVDAETETGEQFRLQRHLFELGTEASGGKEIRISGVGAELARRQRAAWDEAVTRRYRARVNAAAWKIVGWALFTVGFAVAIGLIVYRASRGHGSIGDIVLTITVATSLRQALHETGRQSVEAASSRSLIEPYLWFQDYVAMDRARSKGSEETPRALTEGIVFDGVGYMYPGTDRMALEGISLHIPPGAVVAVVGEYGSGKTTLVKLLGKFYQPSEGTISVDGIDLADLETHGWRARSAAVFQDFGRFETTFAANVGMGDLPHVHDRPEIERAVHEANADVLVARLPQGLDTELGTANGGVDLSEGQWQKTALARSLMRQDPLLFLLDEPTASLDAASEKEILKRHMSRARALGARTGAITVIVSHRFSAVTGADLILVLDNGRLIEAGRHDELVEIEGGRYADLYKVQAMAYEVA
ncbi:ABC transporter ATP-binding protein [Streptomyces sp. NPDC088350]|uniref:ABC transporter ATP-binding protein n=1 Tax=Streptomyces sp. NPDC088350 TaxID=3365854 RepID=UPI0037FD621D